MPTAAPRDAVAGVVGETRVCDGDSGGQVESCSRRRGVITRTVCEACGIQAMCQVASDDTSGCARVHEAAAYWLGPRYSARTTYFGKWRTYLWHSRVAQRLNAGCVPVRSAGPWARNHGRQAGGRGAPVQMSQDQNVTAFLSSERHALRRKASGRAAAVTRSQRGQAFGSAAPFLHDEAGPLLAVLLHVHLLIVRHLLERNCHDASR